MTKQPRGRPLTTPAKGPLPKTYAIRLHNDELPLWEAFRAQIRAARQQEKKS